MTLSPHSLSHPKANQYHLHSAKPFALIASNSHSHALAASPPTGSVLLMMAVDTSPLHTLYTSHHRWLYELLRRRLSNAFDAADLAHDTFIRVLKRPPEFEGERHERSYLATVARGLCIDHWRRRQLEHAWLQALMARPQAVQPSLEQQAIIVETLHEVDAMLQRLPQRVRDAFILAQLHGMTYKAIGSEIGVSERTVKNYLTQALMHCAMLEAELDGLLIE